MSQFAKDVAKQLDRRQRRRRVATLGVLGIATALAAMYLRCGSGFGLGSGSGSGSGAGSGEKRCAIRVSAQGIFVDGKKQTQEGAVAICKRVGSADVIVTGDAREGDWKDLDHALEAEHVDVFLRDH